MVKHIWLGRVREPLSRFPYDQMISHRISDSSTVLNPLTVEQASLLMHDKVPWDGHESLTLLLWNHHNLPEPGRRVVEGAFCVHIFFLSPLVPLRYCSWTKRSKQTKGVSETAHFFFSVGWLAGRQNPSKSVMRLYCR